MSTLTAKIREEVKAIIPPTIYFFVSLHIVAYISILMVKGTGFPLPTSVQITIGALILGKAVLIADMLPLINRFPEKPLAYNVAWKTVIYFLVAFLIHYLERLADYWKADGGFAAANQEMLTKVVWPHFWAVQLILLMLIFNYCVMHELGRVLGAERLRRMFFGPTPDVRT